jgi:hypothetical protein
MIRRNVSGQVIYFPQLTTVDGTPITSAATITVAKDGVEAASAGTLTHSSGGVWKYTPTAGESDAAIVGLVLTGTNAIPVVLNLVTTAANTAAVAFGANTTTPPTAAANADAVWDEPYNQHTTAGTFGKLMDILRKSNTVIEGTILASPTPTTTTFRISGADYPTGALEHAVLWMSTGTSAEQNSPILTTVNNGDSTLTITLEEALVTAPIAGDIVLIDPTSHVHAIVDIVSGVWSALTSGLSVVGSTGRALARLIGLVQDNNGDEFTTKALNRAPSSAGGGDATEAKQDQIISLIQGSEVLTVASPNVRGNLVLTQGDTYDGATGSNPKATWTVSTDYTSGWSVVLTIRDKNDAVVYTNTGTVPNATTVTVPIVTPTVTPYEGCPGVWQGKYDVQLTKSTSKKTIAIGVVYINEDQTRS